MFGIKQRPGAWIAVGVVVALLTPVLSGCGGGGLGSVSGKITLDGQPLAGANVTYMPQQGGGASHGTTDADGQYTLTHASGQRGAVLGAHEVSVTVDEDEEEVYAPEVETNERRKRPQGRRPSNKVPEKYNERTELRQEVSAGKNEFDFELTSE